MALTFGLVVLSTNLWGTEGRGIISITIADIAIIVIFNNLLGGSCISYFSPKIGPEKLILPAYLWIFISTLSGSIIFHLFQPQVNFWYLFFLTLFLSLQSVHLKIFAAKENFKLFNLLSLLLPLLNLVFIFVFFYIFKIKSHNSYFAGYLAALIIIWLLCIPLTRRYFELKKMSFSRSIVKQAFEYGWQTELSYLIHFANYRLSYFLILRYMDLSSVGLYSVGIALAEALWIIVRSISIVQYSKIVNNIGQDNGINLTIDSARLSFYFSVLAAIALLAVPSEGYSIIFGKDFSQIKTVMIVLLPGIISMSFSNVHGHFFTATGKTRPVIIKSIIGLVFTLVFMPFAIKYYGLYGAGIATSVSYLASSVYLIVLFYKKTPFRLDHLSFKLKR